MSKRRPTSAHLPRTQAIGILQLAQSYLDAATMLEQLRGGTSSPRYFLCGHGIELALKAMLVACGIYESALRKIGHDLDAAVDALRQTDAFKDLKLSKQELGMVRWLNACYQTKEFEYLFVGVKSLPHPDDLLGVAGAILANIRPHVERRVRASIANPT